MPWTRIGGVTAGSSDGNSVTSGSLDTSGAELLIGSLSQASGVADAAFSDSKSNSWNNLTVQTESPIKGRLVWSVPTSVGSGHTFTASQASSTPSIAVEAWAYSHASPFDQQNGAHTASGTTLATGSITPTRDNALVVAGLACRAGSGTVDSISGGFTIHNTTLAGASNETVSIATLVQTSIAAANPTWTVSGSGSVKAAFIASFLPKVPSMFAVF